MKPRLWIFSSGTELTRGYSKDTNSSEIAQSFVENGFEISGISILPDDKEILLNYIQYSLSNDSINGIIFTGGLGPTEDDLTIDLFHQITGYKIIEDANSLNKLKEFAARRGINLEIARRQIRVLENSKVILNRSGLAPGMVLEFKKKLIAILPGVPDEMRNMLPEIKKIFLDKFKEKAFYQKERFYIYLEPESEFQKNLNLIKKKYNYENLIWGVSANPGFLKVFLENNDPSKEEVFLKIYNDIQNHYKDQFLQNPIESTIHELLIKEKKTLAVAESCTGGYLGKILTDIPGSSEYFLGSIVSYSNLAKKLYLDVKENTLNQYGAVSKECAEEMLNGLIKTLNPDYGISITGIAGPTGGSKEKPVGLVYIGIYANKNIKIHKIFYPSTRERIRKYTIFASLFFLYQELKKVLQIEK